MLPASSLGNMLLPRWWKDAGSSASVSLQWLHETGTGDGTGRKAPAAYLKRDGPVNQVEVEVLEAEVGERLLHGGPGLGESKDVEHKYAAPGKGIGTRMPCVLQRQSGPANNVLDIIRVVHGVPQLGGHKDVLALDTLVKGGLEA